MKLRFQRAGNIKRKRNGVRLKNYRYEYYFFYPENRLNIIIFKVNMQYNILTIILNLLFILGPLSLNEVSKKMLHVSSTFRTRGKRIR